MAALSTNWQQGAGSPRFGGGMTLYQALSYYPPLLEAALNDPYIRSLLGGSSAGVVPEPVFGMAVLALVVRRRRR